MSERNQSFSEQFVRATGADTETVRQHRRELAEIMERQLSTGDRIARVITFVFAIGWTCTCGWLYAQGESSPVFPVIPPVALLVMAVWYLGYAALFCFSAVRARFSERTDGALFRTWNLWCAATFTVFLFLWWIYQPNLEHRAFYATIALSGFVALAVDAILHRIQCCELATREKLLEIQIAVNRCSTQTSQSTDRQLGSD